MKTLIAAFLAICFLFSCKKKDSIRPNEPPVSIADSVFKILEIVNKNILDIEIKYIAKPPANSGLYKLFLHWSTTADFTLNKDSVEITSTSSQPGIVQLTNLKPATRYFGKISAIYKNIRLYSLNEEWITDTLKIVYVGYASPSWIVNKGDSFQAVRTNLPVMPPNQTNNTKVYIGSYECPINTDEGMLVVFHVPLSIPSKKYILELKRNGISIFSPDSVEVAKGKWTFLNPPDLAIRTDVTTSGLYSFGTCQSPQKGYMVGGNFFNGSRPGYDGMYMADIFEFDPSSRQWTKRVPNTNRYFDNPICYYYNNGIYVIGGVQHVQEDGMHDRNWIVRNMLRLDLSSMNWSEMGIMPTYGNYNMTSFELNNEWYIGMGSDSTRRIADDPQPSKKFWKYNPATDQWTRLSDFPGGDQRYPTCFSVGTKGYAFYGGIPIGPLQTATDFLQELWEYDPFSNMWRQIPLPTIGGPPPGEKYQIITYNEKVYFLTAQTMALGSGYYVVDLQNVCTEWNPTTNIFRRIANPRYGEVLKLVYSQNDQFVFQSDALGAWERIPNKTFLFELDQ